MRKQRPTPAEIEQIPEPDRSVLDRQLAVCKQIALQQLDVNVRQLFNLTKSGTIRTLGQGHHRKFVTADIAVYVGHKK